MSIAIKSVTHLRSPWKTPDPFLFCAYHEDNYPRGNGKMGPDASLSGRAIGQDFSGKDGWSMYHGQSVPGFPAHPHSGFETVTIVERGLVDHTDSLHAAGRFGEGDVQWMTAGKGVQHAEMFPLLHEDKDNPFLLFQIWLNLPEKSRKVDPYYKMLWHEEIPVVTTKDGNDRETSVKIIAGAYEDESPLAPPPDSWAADPSSQIAIWHIHMAPESEWTLPASLSGVNRTLYYYKGSTITSEEREIGSESAIELHGDRPFTIKNGKETSSFILLQGRPINEPVVQYGPFVAANMGEIQQTMMEYQRTQFGGWPWPTHAHVHDKSKGRFAIYTDGTLIEKD